MAAEAENNGAAEETPQEDQMSGFKDSPKPSDLDPGKMGKQPSPQPDARPPAVE